MREDAEGQQRVAPAASPNFGATLPSSTRGCRQLTVAIGSAGQDLPLTDDYSELAR
jgi:hypothetical protein